MRKPLIIFGVLVVLFEFYLVFDMVRIYINEIYHPGKIYQVTPVVPSER